MEKFNVLDFTSTGNRRVLGTLDEVLGEYGKNGWNFVKPKGAVGIIHASKSGSNLQIRLAKSGYNDVFLRVSGTVKAALEGKEDIKMNTLPVQVQDITVVDPKTNQPVAGKMLVISMEAGEVETVSMKDLSILNDQFVTV